MERLHQEVCQSDRLEREQRRVEINANLGSPDEVLLKELDTRRLWTRSIPDPSPAVPHRSSSVTLERLDRVYNLVDDADVGSVNSVKNRTCKRKHVSSEILAKKKEQHRNYSLQLNSSMIECSCKLQEYQIN